MVEASSDPFEAAVAILLMQEGGLADDKDDVNGITHWGISLRYAQSLGATFLDVDHDGKIDAADIRALPVDIAVQVYREEWWERYALDKLAPWASFKALSIAVNMGPKPTFRCLQAAVGALSIDGIIGPQTIARVNAADPSAGCIFRQGVWAEYQARITAHPVLAKYAGGWKRRAYL